MDRLSSIYNKTSDLPAGNRNKRTYTMLFVALFNEKPGCLSRYPSLISILGVLAIKDAKVVRRDSHECKELTAVKSAVKPYPIKPNDRLDWVTRTNYSRILRPRLCHY
jgi:hypothetical protein